jgi:hypothetical protein
VAAHARAELNLLAQLLGAGRGAAEEGKDDSLVAPGSFRLQLFPDDAPGVGGGGDVGPGISVITFDASETDRLARMARELGLDDAGRGSSAAGRAGGGKEAEPDRARGDAGDDDDLLAMMDAATGGM